MKWLKALPHRMVYWVRDIESWISKRYRSWDSCRRGERSSIHNSLCKFQVRWERDRWSKYLDPSISYESLAILARCHLYVEQSIECNYEWMMWLKIVVIKLTRSHMSKFKVQLGPDNVFEEASFTRIPRGVRISSAPDVSCSMWKQ